MQPSHRFAHKLPTWVGSLCLARVSRALLLGCLLAASAVVASPASASSLQIQFTGLDLTYDGSSIFDSTFANTVRAGDPAESDALTSMSFYVDNVLVGSVLTSDIFADVYIAGVDNMPATGGVINTTGNGDAFGIDLLTNNILAGWGLALDIDTMQFFYTGFQIAINVAGLASSIDTQMLPFGLEFDPSEPVTISITSASLTNLTTSGGFLTGFGASSAGVVNGVLVPEPSTIVLLGIGFAAAVWHGLRIRRRR
jgi:hypothetical protein